MSDSIKHECGLALIQLKKPLAYYKEKYGTVTFGLQKLYLLMEKQRNRGQDGAGVAVIKKDVKEGDPYIFRKRSSKKNAIEDIFASIREHFEKAEVMHPEKCHDATWAKKHVPFVGEVMLGHLRYGTCGGNALDNCHPFVRKNNWKNRNLALAGNFNMTNNDELFQRLVDLGQHPIQEADTTLILEKIGHFLDEENNELYYKFRDAGHDKRKCADLIAEQLDLPKVLQKSVKDFDGGFVLGGIVGNSDAFVLRDPCGIRPAFWYQNDEIAVVASERPAIQTAFGVKAKDIQEVQPGHAVILSSNNKVKEVQIMEPQEKKACVFERIYFSRGTDSEIYEERKKLGAAIAKRVLESVDYDFDNTVFSYIPNTSEVAFLGLIEELEHILDQQKLEAIEQGNLTNGELTKLLAKKVRTEKIMVKDSKLRTFITPDNDRDGLVGHVYDVTYGVLKPTDTLVAVDDSIVRGTTLQRSALTILDRLNPKKIVVASSAPQIRYPDCYGIDMSMVQNFIAFRALLSLLKKDGKEYHMQDVYKKCVKADKEGRLHEHNYLKELYDLYSDQEIEDEISHIVRPEHINADVQIMYQTIDALNECCPEHTGDWYFTGNYPTPGGTKVVNRSFMNFVEGKEGRGYS